MQCYWKLNTMIIVVAFCLFLYKDTNATALSSDAEYIGSVDQLSILLISDKGVPMVAMLDTKTINRKRLHQNTYEEYDPKFCARRIARCS